MGSASFNIADLFESLAAALPDRTALVSGSVRATFAELDARADRLAAVLRGRGVGPGAHVGVHLWNGHEYVEAMLAALKLRAVPINLNYRYVAAELRNLCEGADLVADNPGQWLVHCHNLYHGESGMMTVLSYQL